MKALACRGRGQQEWRAVRRRQYLSRLKQDPSMCGSCGLSPIVNVGRANRRCGKRAFLIFRASCTLIYI